MSFNKWKDEYGLEFEPNYSKETELDCKAAFKAGQQSRQAEIDDLVSLVKSSADSEMNLFDELQRVSKDRDELQKQVDNLTNTNESLVAYKNQLLDEIEEKGNKDEN